MRWEEYVIAKECGPVLFEIGKWYRPVHLSGSGITADNKMEAPLGCELDIPFVVGAIVIHGDFRVRVETGGDAIQGRLRWNVSRWGVGLANFGEFFEGRFDGSTIIQEDGVVDGYIVG